ncbi:MULTISPECIES: flagellar export protein FliJ [unclassified Arthrobacter]|uniref:flagellar export protein FliJ n=1 Tax=unclassified Arthrobacter TaxID=235627 RepID=UPI001D15A526|nr:MULTISPECIES: flagellar FliJ family protein [unclassified Arthrobacter]MCC3276458.1 flagellar FliJ family protein [Arthrobacter sp. zg-Y20]MCC3280285.1 flagellar FliJ family protein [Arthrobacter sp. zg-Y40]MCC9178560.1 flagellar FliJ family protein [Arthrobacter sp. zg-Y750]MDK1316618.1 flagellar FliJ family protein [Arthrobacter sp. zg.Y20]WIB06656.1 flagellar FliJ family protein [Arthrobacter sp. zg-Y20]
MPRTFPLAGLLRLRQMQQERAAGELAAANVREKETVQARTEAYSALESSNSQAMDSATLIAIAAARASSRSMLADLNALGARRTAEVEAARAEFSAARARSVGLEKLEGKYAAAEAAEDLRTEQNILDELAGSAWHRRQKEAN